MPAPRQRQPGRKTIEESCEPLANLARHTCMRPGESGAPGLTPSLLRHGVQHLMSPGDQDRHGWTFPLESLADGLVQQVAGVDALEDHG